MKYKWTYVISGTKKPTIAIVFCKGEKEIRRFTDLGMAMQYNSEYKDELENDLTDYVLDSKKKVESSWNREKYKSTIDLIKKSDWDKSQKKFEVKPSF